MAKKYLSKLTSLFEELDLASEIDSPIEFKHFFSGAALYINNSICATWSPVGLAFKLSEAEADKLIETGKAKPLKYFEKGHIKKSYALFDQPDEIKSDTCRQYFVTAAKNCGA